MNPVYTTPSFSVSTILILSYHLCLDLLTGLFPSSFPIKILYAFFFDPMRATCAFHDILLDLIILITFDEDHTLRRCSLCSFLQPPKLSPFFASNILFRTLLPNAFRLCSSLNVRDQVSYCRKYYSFVCFNLYDLNSRREDYGFSHRKVASNTRNQSIFNFLISFVAVVPKCMNCATFSKDLLTIFMLWICPVFWWRDNNTYIIFSAFTSRPIFLLASLFFFMVSILPPSRDQQLMCPF
jgi:hypothetical protein